MLPQNFYHKFSTNREQSMTQYENQLAALRLEVKRLRNYDSYAKEVPYQELHTEVHKLLLQNCSEMGV